MMQLILIAALIGYLIYHFKLKNMAPAERKKMAIRTAITLGLAALIIGAATGRVHWLGGLIAGAIGLARSGLITGLHLGRFWMAKTGGVAKFSTEYVDATFNASNLEIQGRIKKGLFASRELQGLDDAQLQELVTYYQTRDTKSGYLIRALLQRRGFGGSQQDFANMATPDQNEAMDILGLTGKPTREAVIQAHRRLINKLHPDRGGSDYLASQVNLARDQLLQQLEK